MRLKQMRVCKCRKTCSGTRNASLSKLSKSSTPRNLVLISGSQWNVAFGTPPPTASSSSSPPLRPPPSGTNYDMRPQDPNSPNYQLPSVSPQQSGIQGTPGQLPPSSSYAANPSYVTPTMWQEVVASSFQDGLKRRWDQGSSSMVDQSMYKRAR